MNPNDLKQKATEALAALNKLNKEQDGDDWDDLLNNHDLEKVLQAVLDLLEENAELEGRFNYLKSIYEPHNDCKEREFVCDFRPDGSGDKCPCQWVKVDTND